VSDEPSTREVGGKRREREKEKMENNPCTLPTRDKEKKKNSGLTSVRVRINESWLLVRSIVVRGSLTISMKCLRHEGQRGHV
jgi:hypothetical protein